MQMTLEDQLNALIYFHHEEHSSGRHLLQALEEENFAREQIAPKEGIKMSRTMVCHPLRGCRTKVIHPPRTTIIHPPAFG